MHTLVGKSEKMNDQVSLGLFTLAAMILTGPQDPLISDPCIGVSSIQLDAGMVDKRA
jgi:hypothetical protein